MKASLKERLEAALKAEGQKQVKNHPSTKFTVWSHPTDDPKLRTLIGRGGACRLTRGPIANSWDSPSTRNRLLKIRWPDDPAPEVVEAANKFLAELRSLGDDEQVRKDCEDALAKF